MLDRERRCVRIGVRCDPNFGYEFVSTGLKKQNALFFLEVPVLVSGIYENVDGVMPRKSKVRCDMSGVEGTGRRTRRRVLCSSHELWSNAYASPKAGRGEGDLPPVAADTGKDQRCFDALRIEYRSTIRSVTRSSSRQRLYRCMSAQSEYVGQKLDRKSVDGRRAWSGV